MTRDEAVRLLKEADCPASPVNDYKDVANDEHLKENGYIKEMEIKGDGGRSFGKRTILGYPIKFSETPVPELPGQAPLLGEHTAESLRNVGFTDAEIDKFAEDKVVRLPKLPNPDT